MRAPEKIWVTGIGKDPTAHWWHNGKVSGAMEYHLARPNQPCSTDEFLERLVNGPYSYSRIDDWVSGDFTAAMEGL